MVVPASAKAAARSRMPTFVTLSIPKTALKKFFRPIAPKPLYIVPAYCVTLRALYVAPLPSRIDKGELYVFRKLVNC